MTLEKNIQHSFSILLSRAQNVLLLVIPFAFLAYLEAKKQTSVHPMYLRMILQVFSFILLYSYFGRVYDAFTISLKRISDLFIGQLLSVFFADCIIVFVVCLLRGRIVSIWGCMAMLAVQLLFSLLWCVYAHRWYFSKYAGQKAGIIYDENYEHEGLLSENALDKKFDVQFTTTINEFLKSGLNSLDGLDCVFLSGIHSHERNTILKYCVENRIQVYAIPRLGDIIMSGARKMHMYHLPFLRAERYNPPITFLVFKRLFDIVCSFIAILLLSPLMAGLAIAIKLEDGGPVIYRQTRLTKDGREFEMLKFRSMITDAEKDGVARLSTGDLDTRITRVGHFIRSCRFDELPQLFNILMGSMSIVGPRPERPEIAAQYEEQMPEFRLRLQAKAGLTGYAQVYGKYNTVPYHKLQMDLMYIAYPGLINDLRIILATIPVIFEKESTEGVAEGQTTADNGNIEKSA